VSGQEFLNVRIIGKLLENQAHGDTCPPHHRLPSQDPWIGGDAFFERTRIFFHINQLYHTDVSGAKPVAGGFRRVVRGSE
jgi:hypothetical protein